jgi:hypothetical protein
MAIYQRYSHSIHLWLIVWIAATSMLQILVLGIAKGNLSQFPRYNITIGVLAGFAVLVDLSLMLIQYCYGDRQSDELC